MVSLAAVTACGGGSPARQDGEITVLMGRAPDSLDPGVAHSPEAFEADWLAYTPLLTFAHSSGVTGTRLIPGLATDLPKITAAGTRYSFTLRPGLVYSDGQAVKAGDFEWAVERAIKLRWTGARNFIVGRIVGAAAFAANRADHISGIQTDDTSGQITIDLTSAYGSFDDVLALPALAPVPRTTPLRDERAAPPAGIGPYSIERVVPGRSFALVPNPRWERAGITGIPSGHADIDVRISQNLTANATAVLRNTADAFDAADQVPEAMLGRARAAMPDRYSRKALNATYAIFLNPDERPFSSALAREAVLTGLDRGAVARMAAETLLQGCYLLPPAMPGHPSAPCRYGPLLGGGDVARARALVQRSGMSGAHVTIRSAAGWPASVWTAYYVSLLDRIGFIASVSMARRGNLQTGVVGFTAQLPDPTSIYGELVVPGRLVDDPRISSQMNVLATVPAGQLDAVSSAWMGLDEYTAMKGYLAVLGYPTAPVLVSNRIDDSAVVFQPVVGIDWSSLKLR